MYYLRREGTASHTGSHLHSEGGWCGRREGNAVWMELFHCYHKAAGQGDQTVE